MTVFGWDASDYDWDRGPMDLEAAVRDGISFFTHKATEGTRTRHVHYGEAMRRARAAGMPLLGAYIVPRTPGNSGHGTIAQQVAYALAYLDAQTPWWRSTREFFLQVDTEHWGYDDVSPALGAQMCAELRRQTGQWVVHYAPRWAYGDTIPGSDPLWASAYGSNPAVPYRQAYPGDNSSGWAPYSGRTPTFLQYGSKLTIGSQPSCDANAFRGTLDQLRALITRGDDMTTGLDATTTTIDGKPHTYGELLTLLASELLMGGAYDLNGKGSSASGRIRQLEGRLDAITAGGPATREQVVAAVASVLPETLKDPEVAKALGAGFLAALRES